MKRLLGLFVLMAVVILTSLLPVPSGAAPMSTAGPGSPMDCGDNPIKDFVIPSTQTLSLCDTAKLVGTVPSSCHTMWICAAGGVNVGDASVTVGLGATGIPIASGSYMKFALRQDGSAPKIYLINAVSGATSTARLFFAR